MDQSDHLASLLQAAIAVELRHVRALIERLAEVLIGDAHVAATYVEQLQAFDLLIQCADETASVLDRLSAGHGAHAAVAPVRLDVIQDRLRAALAQTA